MSSAGRVTPSRRSRPAPLPAAGPRQRHSPTPAPNPTAASNKLGVALSDAPVWQLEHVLEPDAHGVALGDGRRQHIPGPRAVAVPKLRNPIRDTPRDRAGLVSATADLDQRAHDLVRERAPRELVGIIGAGEAHLDGDPGVRRGADDPRPAEVGQRDRDEVRRAPPRPYGGGARKRIGIDRRGGRQPDGQPGRRRMNRVYHRVARGRRHRLGTASIARVHVHRKRARPSNRNSIRRELGRRQRDRSMLGTRAPAIEACHHRYVSHEPCQSYGPGPDGI